MDCVKIIESLDSIWFFSNVLSPTPQPLRMTVGDGTDVCSPKSEPPSKPMIPTLQTKQARLIDDIMVQECLQCDDLVAEDGHLRVKEEEKGVEKKGERRRSKIRYKSRFDNRRKVVKELDFGLDLNEVHAFWKMLEETRGGYEQFGGQNEAKMPAFGDGMAMKEHLKSWAYAVACNVR